jgi:predicted amidohydrolase
MQSTQIAEPMTGPTVRWMQQQAQFYQLAITGSLAIETELGVVNRLIFVHPDGSIDYYDKKHLFRMAGEHQHYAAGSIRSVVLFKGFRLNLQICYDLRFPVFARNQGDYDVLIYVANWPEPRRRIWSTLLAARAMENQAFVLGCNRVGQDGNQFSYSGDSVALNYLGEPMAELPAGQSGIITATLRLSDLQQFRQQFPAALDADAFVLVEH